MKRFLPPVHFFTKNEHILFPNPKTGHKAVALLRLTDTKNHYFRFTD